MDDHQEPAGDAVATRRRGRHGAQTPALPDRTFALMPDQGSRLDNKMPAGENTRHRRVPVEAAKLLVAPQECDHTHSDPVPELQPARRTTPITQVK